MTGVALDLAVGFAVLFGTCFAIVSGFNYWKGLSR